MHGPGVLGNGALGILLRFFFFSREVGELLPRERASPVQPRYTLGDESQGRQQRVVSTLGSVACFSLVSLTIYRCPLGQ